MRPSEGLASMAPSPTLGHMVSVAGPAQGRRQVRTDVHPWVQVISLGDALLRAADAAPTADAVVLPDARLTYAELGARAQTLAAGLVGLGVRPGDRVGVLMANR